jgi:hypothetical protein
MIVAPERISALEPKRSRSKPAGTCALAYTTICRTTNDDSTPGLAVNRSPASSPETPSVVRSRTATTYAKSPVAQTIQGRNRKPRIFVFVLMSAAIFADRALIKRIDYR